MKTTQTTRTKHYKVTAIIREKGDPKSVSNAVRIAVPVPEFDITESQALNLVDALEDAIEKLRDA